MYKIRRLQPESHSRMKRGSSEMPPRVANLQKNPQLPNKRTDFFVFVFSSTFFMVFKPNRDGNYLKKDEVHFIIDGVLYKHKRPSKLGQ